MKTNRSGPASQTGARAAGPGSTLALEGITARAGSFRLGPLSLRVPAGEYLVLLGPSGCGKTTLLRLVCGLAQQESGLVVLDGTDIGRLPPEKRRIGYLPQEPALFPHLDVSGNIAFGLSFSGLDRDARQKRLGLVIGMLELEKLAGRPVHGLSGGESRKVALARSLAASPRLLLLDEPLGMLDPNSREEMRRTLRTIHRETAICAVHVTHDREEARDLAGKCALMNAGRLEQEGPVETLFGQPETRFAARFTGAGNIVPVVFERQGDRLMARAGQAVWPVSGPASPGPGHVLVRPDACALDSPGPGAPALSGTVREAHARGPCQDISLEIPGAGTVRSRLPNDRPPPAPGARLTIHLLENPRALRD